MTLNNSNINVNNIYAYSGLGFGYINFPDPVLPWGPLGPFTAGQLGTDGTTITSKLEELEQKINNLVKGEMDLKAEKPLSLIVDENKTNRLIMLYDEEQFKLEKDKLTIDREYIEKQINVIIQELDLTEFTATINERLDKIDVTLKDYEDRFTLIEKRFDSKQDKLVAGTNITIEDNVISAKGSSGETVDAKWGSIKGEINNQTDLFNELQKKQNTLKAGSGIEIKGDTISSTVTSTEKVDAKWGEIKGNISEQLDLFDLLEEKQDKLTVGNNLQLESNHLTVDIPIQKATEWGDITGNIKKQTDLDIEFSKKQNTLSVGDNLHLEDNHLTVDIPKQQDPTWGNIKGQLANQTDLTNALNNKQNKLTAGSNISITGETISSHQDITNDDVKNLESITKLDSDIKLKQDKFEVKAPLSFENNILQLEKTDNVITYPMFYKFKPTLPEVHISATFNTTKGSYLINEGRINIQPDFINQFTFSYLNLPVSGVKVEDWQKCLTAQYLDKDQMWITRNLQSTYLEYRGNMVSDYDNYNQNSDNIPFEFEYIIPDSTQNFGMGTINFRMKNGGFFLKAPVLLDKAVEAYTSAKGNTTYTQTIIVDALDDAGKWVKTSLQVVFNVDYIINFI